jgi:hypothetical protein
VLRDEEAHCASEDGACEVEVLPEHGNADCCSECDALLQLRDVGRDLAQRLDEIGEWDQVGEELADHEGKQWDDEQEERLGCATEDPKLEEECDVLERVEEAVQEDREGAVVEQGVDEEERRPNELNRCRWETETGHRPPSLI